MTPSLRPIARLAALALTMGIAGGCFMPDQPSLGATARDDHACRTYGAAPESQPYLDCRLRRIDRREVELAEKQRTAEWREDLKSKTSRGEAARAQAAAMAAEKAQAEAATAAGR